MEGRTRPSKKRPAAKRPAAKRAPAKRKAAPSPATSTHRRGDLAGILLLALAGCAAFSLYSWNPGTVGRAMGGSLRLMFGSGSWAVPVGLSVLAISVWRGRGLAVTYATYGILCLFASLLGFLARPIGGDFFDPLAIRTHGGYVGAILGWAGSATMGNGAVVLYGALALIGLVLCVDVPLRTMAASAARTTGKGVAKLKPIPRPVDERPSPAPAEIARRSTWNPFAGLPFLRAAGSPATEEPPTREDLPPAERLRPAPTVRPEPAKSVKPVERPIPKPDPIRELKLPDLDEGPVLDAALPIPKEGYELPPLSLLRAVEPAPERPREEMEANIATLERTLEQFGIDSNVVEVATGPTVTRYEIQIGPGIKVARVSALGENIAMELAATQVRVEAPIPGKNAVGVEVPNAVPTMVSLRELCEHKEFQNHKSRLCVALGKDVGGQAKYADLTRMPHLLIGGATNSGKSIGLATLITSLLMRNTPKDVRLVMIDPKRVELTLFDNIPHLMCPVIKDVKEAAGVLRAVWREMDRRYDLFSEHGVRNIDGWNEKAIFNDRLPYIVVIVDELADLMIQCRAEVETTIVRLAQLARAVGIHLVLATQRPSVDVITGLIKANIPSRIAFSVASQIDSRTILDGKGAENLIGKGDMLFAPIDANRPHRVQGCYVSEKEIEEICRFWRDQQAPEYVLSPIDEDVEDAKKEAGDFSDEADPLYADSVRWAAERGEVSTSMLQRRFAIGFQRASRIIDMMEARGIVGRRDGSRPRDVLINLNEVEGVLAGGAPGPRYDVGATIGDGLED